VVSLLKILWLVNYLKKNLRGNVRTADGQKQYVLGIISPIIKFYNREKPFEFLIVPTMKEEVICGMDFVREFGLKVSLDSEPIVNSIEGRELEDKIKLVPLTESEHKKLQAAISALPSFELEGLGCTTLIEHKIDAGTAEPIKQRFYPISPAVENKMGKEIDRML